MRPSFARAAVGSTDPAKIAAVRKGLAALAQGCAVVELMSLAPWLHPDHYR